MSSSEISDTFSVVSSECDVSVIDDLDELEDFVVVSPVYYPNHHITDPSAHSSAAAASDWTEISKVDHVKDCLFDKGREHVAAVETCRYYLRPSDCGRLCNGPIKCNACVSLIAGLETLANCACEWSNDNKPFRDKVSNILHCLHRLPFRFQFGLYSVIGAVMGNVEDWPAKDQESFEMWGFKVSAVLWLLRIGVHGLARTLQEGKEWRPLMAEVERSWYQEHVVAEEYEEAVENIQRFAIVFRKWGENVNVQHRAQSPV